MHERHGVSIVGPVKRGLPSPTVPAFSNVSSLLVSAITITAVSLCLNISVATMFAQKYDYRVRPNQVWLIVLSWKICSTSNERRGCLFWLWSRTPLFMNNLSFTTNSLETANAEYIELLFIFVRQIRLSHRERSVFFCLFSILGITCLWIGKRFLILLSMLSEFGLVESFNGARGKRRQNSAYRWFFFCDFGCRHSSVVTSSRNSSYGMSSRHYHRQSERAPS